MVRSNPNTKREDEGIVGDAREARGVEMALDEIQRIVSGAKKQVTGKQEE